jgi:hypothetical protein
MKRPIRIALTGLAGSGKSTSAKYLENSHGFRRISYAAPIKRMMRCLLIEAGAGFLEAVEMVDGALKELPTPYLCGHSTRYGLQNLGTEYGRELISRDIWRRILLRKVAATEGPAVVDDLRMADEAEDLRLAGFTLVRITRPGSGTKSAHSSEAGDFPVDVTIDNDRGLSYLHSRIDEIVASLHG